MKKVKVGPLSVCYCILLTCLDNILFSELILLSIHRSGSEINYYIDTSQNHEDR